MGGSFEKGSQQSFQVPEQGAELITLAQSVTTSTNIRNDPSGLEIKQATKADVIKICWKRRGEDFLSVTKVQNVRKETNTNCTTSLSFMKYF